MVKWVLKLASTPIGSWFFLSFAPPIDRLLLRLSRGRFSLGGSTPILLLLTTGAKSGEPRSTPLFYLRDGERFVLIASRGGHQKHPAWYHNLLAHPEATVLVGGCEIPCRSDQAAGDEHQRLWQLAVEANPGYAVYQSRLPHRRIPVMILTPQER
jgi:deazaflavin-dependent oxidoreductase (nitroreductase family)